MYFSCCLCFNPQNLGWQEEWSPNWWGIIALRFSSIPVLSPSFLAKAYLRHFCMWCITLLLSLFTAYKFFPMFLTMWFRSYRFYNVLFKSVLIWASTVVSRSPSKTTTGVPLSDSFLIPWTPLLHSINFALPTWLRTHLCLRTGIEGLFLLHQLQFPHVLWRTTDLITLFPYLALLIKKVWEVKLSNLFLCHAVSATADIPCLVVHGYLIFLHGSWEVCNIGCLCLDGLNMLLGLLDEVVSELEYVSPFHHQFHHPIYQRVHSSTIF